MKPKRKTRGDGSGDTTQTAGDNTERNFAPAKKFSLAKEFRLNFA